MLPRASLGSLSNLKLFIMKKYVAKVRNLFGSTKNKDFLSVLIRKDAERYCASCKPFQRKRHDEYGLAMLTMREWLWGCDGISD